VIRIARASGSRGGCAPGRSTSTAGTYGLEEFLEYESLQLKTG
jgi:hypothetical protein